MQWLTPAKALDLVPFLRPDGLLAATFHARDGFLDPHGVVAALRARPTGWPSRWPPALR